MLSEDPASRSFPGFSPFYELDRGTCSLFLFLSSLFMPSSSSRFVSAISAANYPICERPFLLAIATYVRSFVTHDMGTVGTVDSEDQ